jgi:undecaprenyl-diphosphatase
MRTAAPRAADVARIAATGSTQDATRMSPAATVGLAAVAVALVALGVLARSNPILPGDLAITRALQGVRAPWFHGVLHPFNLLGFPPLVGIVYGAIAVVVYLWGDHRAGVSCAFAGMGGATLNLISKSLVNRPRPPAELVHVEHVIRGSAFPAGHVLNFTAFAGLLAYLVWVRVSSAWPRRLLLTMLVSMIVLMGLARIDSGEHWASDVLGGYLLGGLWLAVTIRLYRGGRRRQSPTRLIGSSVRS